MNETTIDQITKLLHEFFKKRIDKLAQVLDELEKIILTNPIKADITDPVSLFMGKVASSEETCLGKLLEEILRTLFISSGNFTEIEIKKPGVDIIGNRGHLLMALQAKTSNRCVNSSSSSKQKDNFKSIKEAYPGILCVMLVAGEAEIMAIDPTINTLFGIDIDRSEVNSDALKGDLRLNGQQSYFVASGGNPDAYEEVRTLTRNIWSKSYQQQYELELKRCKEVAVNIPMFRPTTNNMPEPDSKARAILEVMAKGL